MVFAMDAHKDHKRKYTNGPYSEHLAEVAGIVAAVAPYHQLDNMVAVSWLHDCVEDVGVTKEQLVAQFGPVIANGVMLLSDLEIGNRAARKTASRVRLAGAPSWVQTIKVADLISNTSRIVERDPKFAVTHLAEKRLMLDVLTRADRRLIDIARAQIDTSIPSVTP